MLFNSIDYFVFLLAVILVYYQLPYRHRWILLLATSYYFYMCWNAFYALLIVLTTAIDYFAALRIHDSENPRARNWWLAASMTSNLGLLFSFKYWNFFWGSLGLAADALSLPWQPPYLDVLLPVGISFYTFQTMSYVIDVYRRHIEPERHFGRFALFITFFPQLVAGPIERATTLIPALRTNHDWNWDHLYIGSQKILFGLFKKVVIADRLGIYVDAIYGNVGQHNGTTYLLATYAFAFQIYCDFSGYSDIAVGSAKLLGIDLMENFRQPYLATNIRDFWRRWHISLSTWLRDYLYIPLGGSRISPLRTQVNLMLTMVLGGLWHGASWNFVIWGSLQGVMLIVCHQTIEHRDRLWASLGVPNWLRDAVRMVITFHLCCLSWVFFRAASLSDAMEILGSIAQGEWSPPFLQLATIVYAMMGLVVLLVAEKIQSQRGSGRDWLNERPWAVRWAVWYSLMFMVILTGVQGSGQFIYFQF
ncbi:MAG: MBOAT family protein [Planctomycetota bacterium]